MIPLVPHIPHSPQEFCMIRHIKVEKNIFWANCFSLFSSITNFLGAQRLIWQLLQKGVRYPLLAMKNVFMITSNCHNTTKWLDHCETLTGLTRWILYWLVRFDEIFWIGFDCQHITISVSGSAECASGVCAYEVHDDFTNFCIKYSNLNSAENSHLC